MAKIFPKLNSGSELHTIKTGKSNLNPLGSGRIKVMLLHPPISVIKKFTFSKL